MTGKCQRENKLKVVEVLYGINLDVFFQAVWRIPTWIYRFSVFFRL